MQQSKALAVNGEKSAREPRIITTTGGWVKDENGLIWLPRICPKQFEIFNDYHRYLLVTGPRKSAKTIGILHKIMRHCFDLKGARVAIFTKTVKNAKSGGIYIDLTEIVLPEWLEGNIGMELTQKPKVSGDTRQNSFKVSNRHGTDSEVQLHSLEYPPEVIDKLKGTRFSLIFFSEIDNWEDRVIFDIATDQLRMWPNIPYDQHQFIGDCNPPESGPNNWQHDLWFKEKERSTHPNPTFQKNIHRIEFKLDDNPFLPDEEKEELKQKYAYRKSLYNRFVLGMWEEDSTEGHFSEVFRPDIHVLGDVRKPAGEEEVIVPSPACRELLTGWDIGDRNHAAHIIEKLETRATESAPVITKFAVLDELVSLDRNISIREFTEAFMEKMSRWEEFCLKEYKTVVKWRHWSDNSAFRFRAAAESSDELIVREVSRGKIMLGGAPKYRNSVRDRVKITNQLLYEQRLFFSATCHRTITAIRALRKGHTEVEFVAPPEHKHAFDSMSYVLIAEVPIDLILFADVTVGKKPRRLVCV